jgi:hypothetical protein
MFDRVSHPWLGSLMENNIDPIHGFHQGLEVEYIRLDKPVILSPRIISDVSLLSIIERIEVVVRNDIDSSTEQGISKMRTDKTSSTSY